MKENKKYYKVVCMCGHVGRKKYVPIAFAIKADSGREAARIARGLPRVKKQRKDAILDCREISKEQYEQLLRINKKDPYLHCSSVQERRQYRQIVTRIVEIKRYDYDKDNEKPLSKKYKDWKRLGKFAEDVGFAEGY